VKKGLSLNELEKGLGFGVSWENRSHPFTTKDDVEMTGQTG
jgi:hypothetical protein